MGVLKGNRVEVFIKGSLAIVIFGGPSLWDCWLIVSILGSMWKNVLRGFWKETSGMSESV